MLNAVARHSRSRKSGINNYIFMNKALFFRRITFVAIMFGALSFFSCSKDDKGGDGSNSSLLVGKWHFVKEISDDGNDVGYGQKDDFIIFEQNGKFNLSFYGGQEKENGTWKYSSPKLTMTYKDENGKTITEDDGTEVMDISTVENLTDSELIYLTDWGMRFYFDKVFSIDM